ncbi:hypothetical protein GW915_02535 [bacterium]|nr:hypothetical protein [bacterium]
MANRLLLVSPQGTAPFEKFTSKFETILSNPTNLVGVRSIEEAQDFFIEVGDPILLFLDVTQKGFDLVGSQVLSDFFSGVRKLDQNACILMVKDEMPNGADLMRWLDRGATGVVHLDFDPEKLSDSLSDMLELRLKLARRTPRAPASHSMLLRISSIEQAVVSETLNVGHGGFFVGSIIPGAKADDLINFEFVQGEGELSLGFSAEGKDPLAKKIDDDDVSNSLSSQTIQGLGRIVWIRKALAGNEPEGMGVEFVELSDPSKKWVEKYVRNRRIHAFIPKA